MKKAIVTLAVGERCLVPWERFLRSGWQEWSQKHGYDLIVFDEPLDCSLRASCRSPAWQKLLAMASPQLRVYEQALWLDADVLLNPSSPDPLNNIPIDTIGMARDCGSPLSMEPLWFKKKWSEILRISLLTAHKTHWGWIKTVENDLFSYYDLWGFNSRKIILYNTGVIAFSPLKHGKLFLDIYNRWHDGGPGTLHEMIPFNLELIQLGIVHEIESTFNQLAGVHIAVWKNNPLEVQKLNGFSLEEMNADCFLDALLEKSNFLHFAGLHSHMNTYLKRIENKNILNL